YVIYYDSWSIKQTSKSTSCNQNGASSPVAGSDKNSSASLHDVTELSYIVLLASNGINHDLCIRFKVHSCVPLLFDPAKCFQKSPPLCLLASP
ncbi:hypothetical protein LINPERHAP1_LOCUS7054, partial [Linum perenne]